MKSSPKPTPETWLQIIASAYALFDDAVAKGFGDPPFSLGGGTVLMLRFKHRLSKDIDLFGYDAQWLSVFSPRLNERAASLAERYTDCIGKYRFHHCRRCRGSRGGPGRAKGGG